MSRSFISIIVAISFSTSPLAIACPTPFDEKAKECTDAAAKEHGKYSSELATIKGAHQNDMKEMSRLSGVAAATCNSALSAVADKCTERQKDCGTCPDERQQQVCEKKLGDAAGIVLGQARQCMAERDDFLKTAGIVDGSPPPGGADPSAPSGPGGSPGDTAGAGGGSDSLMPLLMGAGIGALAGYMMGKDKDDKKDEAKPGEPTETETPRTPADCETAGTESNPECNASYEQKCTDDPGATGCPKFMADYCSTGSASTVGISGSSDGSSDPADTSTAADTGGNKGMGVGSAFCNTVAFCANSAHSNCLTCIEGARTKPAACKGDPSTCISQYSQAEIDQAKAACPVDPKFADPKFAAGGDSGAPAVILPNSVGRGPASDIEGRYGASVFSISSNTFKKMCDEGRLNCQ
jgi:hypothetical protein